MYSNTEVKVLICYETLLICYLIIDESIQKQLYNIIKGFSSTAPVFIILQISKHMRVIQKVENVL